MLGQYLNEVISGENEILTLYNENPGNCPEYNSVKMNLTEFKKLFELVNLFKPDAVIHTAAISRPETCDALPPDYVNEVNVNSTKRIAELCDKNKIKLIFTSTDLVYDGEQGSYLDENAKLNPASLYAETKLKSEYEIKNLTDDYVTLRTSLLYGIGYNHSRNNFHFMLNNFIEGKPSRLFYDQYRTPLWLKDAAELIREIMNQDIKSETINFGGKERISRTELAEIVCDEGGFDKGLIERISMDDVKGLHKVKDVSMNTSKLNSFGINQKSVESSVREILNNFFNVYRKKSN